MATAFQWYFLIISSLAAILSAAFVILLFRQFIKKRTLGTILLTISFLFVSIAENFTAISQILYVIKGDNMLTGHLQISFVFCYGLAYVFFYYFSNRHILQDKDFLRATITILSTTLVVAISVFMFAEVMFDILPENRMFYETIILSGPDVIQFLPQQLVGLIIYIPVFALIHVRIVIKIIKIRRDVENPINKRGFTYILFSVLFMVISTLVASFYLIPGASDVPFVVGILHTLRGITASISIVLGYFGWILPDWLKKRIRGKAWIVQQISKEVVREIDPIASSYQKEPVAVEISEQ